MKEIENGTEIIPGWEAVRYIGGGSFGKVYEAKKTGCEDGEEFHSAIKVISIPQSPEEYDAYRDDGFDEESITTIFKSRVDDITSEFKMMSRLKGVTNIVSYEDHEIVQHEDKHGWDVIIRMEMLTSLPDIIRKNGFSEKEVVQLGIDICSALELCEKNKLLHRDIKPENIFSNKYGNYKLGDFGVAKTMDHATHGSKIGTVNYMAPEIYYGKLYDAKIDQYSLGLVMYWLLNERRLPFLPLPPEIPKMRQQEEAIERRMRGEALPRPKNGSDELARIVLRACAYEPSERYSSPSEMKAALQSILARSDEKSIVGFDASKEETKDGCPPSDEGTEAPPKEFEKTVNLFDCKTDKQENEGSDKTTILSDFVMNANGGENSDAVRQELKKEPSEAPAEERKAEPKQEEEPKQNQNQLQEQKSDQKKKKWLLPVTFLLATAAVVLGTVMLILCLRSCSDHTPENSTQTSETMDETDSETSAESSTDISVPVLPVVAYIETEQLPEKLEYFIGETLDAKGLKLKVHYEDGTEEIIDDGFEFSPLAFSKVGEESVSVIYQEKTTTFVVNVKEDLVISIAIKNYPNKTDYYVDDTLDPNGLTLTAEYESGKTETVESDFTCSPTILDAVGTKTITVTYKDYTAAFTVTVKEDSVTSIAIKSKPEKMNYYVGESLNTSGLSLTVKYGSGKTATVSKGFSCSPTSLSSAGTKTITVTYGSKTASFSVTVKEDSVTSIAIKSKPTKTEYSVGETLNTSGLKLTVKYGSGKTATITSGFSCSPMSFNSSGTKTITVTYQKKTATFSVTVKQNEEKDTTLIYQAVSGGYEVTGVSNKNCTKVSIPSTYNGKPVVSIGDKAFANCKSLTTVTIPSSVKSIGNHAFYECESLTGITIPSSVNAIGGWAFDGCKSISSFTIPSGVTSIGTGAFQSCSGMSKITIPKSVTSIGEYAFNGCKALKTVYYSGTETQWKAIVIRSGNDLLKSANVICNRSFVSDGFPVYPVSLQCQREGFLCKKDSWL